ncbi:MAG: acyl-CoA dehydrogenase [Alphaproteobacteria bacterium]|nr:acyl-CoA dehydrogenase [Alphaproteobacteria bacterium]
MFEGHINAVKLAMLYGGEQARTRVAQSVHAGELLGVWGADDPESPLTLTPQGGSMVLGGAKRFASGLGLVRQAVVAVNGEAGPLLALAPTGDPARGDASGWTVSGMRATQSGRYDFAGVELAEDDLLGVRGDYTREPHFEGGIWRYCAAHCGGAEALFARFRAALLERGRIADPHQLDRIAAGAIALETMRLWLWRAAEAVEARDAAPDTATLALLARQVTENNCRAVLSLVERGLGMAAHEEGTAIERIRRDLGLFLCQAQPDAKRQRAARAMAESGLRAEDL